MEREEEKLLKELIDFDDDFPKGIYAVPSPKCLPKYAIRRIAKYMEENGIEGPLSKEELKQFRIEPKGYICKEVQCVEEATHWLATFDDAIDECEVTPFQLYRIFHDKYDDEHLIIDDNGNFSLIYLWHEGRFVVLEETRK
ncbi:MULTISPECIES: hypothetical protein [Brevibacillus]|uniref:hypothetical protein n=1 Tax=Brevibacillus TaxID=55080 RepID=UPI00286FF9C7|nr:MULTISPECIES: hypothetical protein [Brevibacillus]MDR9507582.1 hypothetical protein [Brevibacillus agri]WNF05537.1 hypothetical protein RFB14_24945 [Brevibacillus borstelensis]